MRHEGEMRASVSSVSSCPMPSAPCPRRPQGAPHPSHAFRVTFGRAPPYPWRPPSSGCCAPLSHDPRLRPHRRARSRVRQWAQHHHRRDRRGQVDPARRARSAAGRPRQHRGAPDGRQEGRHRRASSTTPTKAACRRCSEHDGIDPSENGILVVRREITEKGSRAFINDTPATLDVLREVASNTIDLHGQHEHQSLLADRDARRVARHVRRARRAREHVPDGVRGRRARSSPSGPASCAARPSCASRKSCTPSRSRRSTRPTRRWASRTTWRPSAASWRTPSGSTRRRPRCTARSRRATTRCTTGSCSSATRSRTSRASTTRSRRRWTTSAAPRSRSRRRRSFCRTTTRASSSTRSGWTKSASAWASWTTSRASTAGRSRPCSRTARRSARRTRSPRTSRARWRGSTCRSPTRTEALSTAAYRLSQKRHEVSERVEAMIAVELATLGMPHARFEVTFRVQNDADGWIAFPNAHEPHRRLPGGRRPGRVPHLGQPRREAEAAGARRLGRRDLAHHARAQGDPRQV